MTEASRILIAEDEFLLAIQLEEQLRSSGFSIVGPVNSLDGAIRASNRETFDLAILDINLNGELVYPLADELSAAGIPFIFLSGYLSADLPQRFKPVPQVAKPYALPDLIRTIRQTLTHVG